MPAQFIDADASVGYLFSDVSRLMRAWFDVHARELGLTRSQWRVLVNLAPREGVNQRALAEILELDVVTLSRHVDRLEAAGMVERRRDPEDRRAWRLHLGEGSRPLIPRMRALAEETQDAALAGLSTPEREALVAMLLRIKANVSPEARAAAAARAKRHATRPRRGPRNRAAAVSLIGRLFASLRRALTRLLLMVVGPAAIAVGGYQVWMSSGRHVTTENAYVKADIITVAAEVPGTVVEVAVANNQRVAEGDLLFRLDPTRFEIERDGRAAELAAARLHVEALKARHRTALSNLQGAIRDGAFLHDDLERTRALAEGGTVSNIRLLAAQRALAQAESRTRLAVEEIGEALAALAGDPDGPVDAHPEVRRALAALREAEHDLAAATVRAPADAYAANVRLQPGEYVEDGAAVMTLIDAGRVWIEANLKETDLTHLREGQPAVFEVDAYPGLTWTAKLASLAPATGAEFALLPPQNASGNWVKVVQRVPVTLEIEPASEAPKLRAGMSVAVSIDTGWQRPTPAPIAAAAAWIRGAPR